MFVNIAASNSLKRHYLNLNSVTDIRLETATRIVDVSERIDFWLVFTTGINEYKQSLGKITVEEANGELVYIISRCNRMEK